jgi:hypothetical protein
MPRLTNNLAESPPAALPAFAAPSALVYGGAGSAGVSPLIVRADHVHALPALPPAIGFGTFAARAAGTTAGQIYISTDSAVPMSIWDGTAWRPYLQSALGTQPPAVAGWSAFNAGGTSSLADTGGCLQFVGTDDGTGAVGTLRGYTLPLPIGSQPRIELGALDSTPDTAVTSSFDGIVVGMRESATNKAFGLCRFHGMASSLDTWETNIWTSNTARTATTRGYACAADVAGGVFMRVRLDGAGNILAEASRDLTQWSSMGQSTVAAAFTVAPNQLFVGALGAGCVPSFKIVHLVGA